MKTNTSLFILWIILVTSALSGILLFSYLDPESNLRVAFIAMGTSAFLAAASFLALTLYLFKKIYYRGEPHAGTLRASVRQGAILSGGLMAVLIFNAFALLTIRTGLLLIFIALLMELMFESVSKE